VKFRAKRRIAMKLPTGVLILSTFFLFLGGVFSHAEDNTASGTLTANDKTYQMKYAYVDEGPDDIVLVLTDAPLEQENIPFGLQEPSMEGKVHGLVVTISKATKAQAPGLNAIYDESWGGQLGTLGNAVLTIDKLDTKTMEGRISTPEKNTFSDYTYAFDVKFKTALGVPKETVPVEVTVKSDGTPAADAYAAYYKALMAGDIPTVKKLILKENAERLDDETAGMIVEIAQMSHPKDIEIKTVNISDTSAELAITGSGGVSQGTGTAEMTLEDGQWKVAADKWKFQN